VRVAVQKLDGVDAVGVSLNQGLATIHFAPGNRTTVEAVRAAIRANGFTPKAAEVRLSGVLTEHEGAPAVALPGTDAIYLLDSRTSAAGGVVDTLRRGVRLTVTGQVPESRDYGDRRPLTLVVGTLDAGR